MRGVLLALALLLPADIPLQGPAGPVPAPIEPYGPGPAAPGTIGPTGWFWYPCEHGAVFCPRGIGSEDFEISQII